MYSATRNVSFKTMFFFEFIFFRNPVIFYVPEWFNERVDGRAASYATVVSEIGGVYDVKDKQFWKNKMKNVLDIPECARSVSSNQVKKKKSVCPAVFLM